MSQKMRYEVTIFCTDNTGRVLEKIRLLLSQEGGSKMVSSAEIWINQDIEEKELVRVTCKKVTQQTDDPSEFESLEFEALEEAAKGTGLSLNELVLLCEEAVFFFEVGDEWEDRSAWAIDSENWINVDGKKLEPANLSSLHALRMQVRKLLRKIQNDEVSNRRAENIKNIQCFTRWEEIPDELISKLALEIFRVQLTSPSKAADTK